MCESRGVGKPQSWEPTPEQIREECLKIQEGWSDEERRRRRGGLPLKELRKADQDDSAIKARITFAINEETEE